MKKYRSILIILFFALLPISVNAAKIKGRISTSFYNQDDDASSYDYNILRTSIKFEASDFAGANKSFNFRGNLKNTWGNEYNKETPDSRIYNAYFEIDNTFWGSDITIGRHYINQLPGARVDGIHLKHGLPKDGSFGLFGGLKPDPYKDQFTSSYKTFGAYWKRVAELSSCSLGYVSTLYKGEEDSSFLYGSGYYQPSKAMSIYLSSRGDHNVDNGSYELTNLLGRFNYRFGRISRISISYNQYRGIKLYRSMDYDIDYPVQKSVRFYGDYRITKITRVYFRYDHRTRGDDNKKASIYMVGLRQSRIFKWFFADFSYRSIRYFTARITRHYGSLGFEAGDYLTFEFSAAKSKNKQDNATNAMEQFIYTGSVTMYPTKKLYLTASYELSSEKYLSVDSIYTAKADDAYRTKSIFIMVGYRF